jgi:hypothetical protein
MTTFTVTIEDESHLDGITAAREAYNTSVGATVTNEQGEQVPNPALLATDEEYVQFVMSKAAESYSKQYNT